MKILKVGYKVFDFSIPKELYYYITKEYYLKEPKIFETKKGENAGKFFYCCNFYPKKCNFFQWKDTEPKQPTPEEMKCYCGYEPTKKRANTENNKGREFFVCNKSYKKCKFFKWVDE